jgi:hypothetical protein
MILDSKLSSMECTRHIGRTSKEVGSLQLCHTSICIDSAISEGLLRDREGNIYRGQQIPTFR